MSPGHTFGLIGFSLRPENPQENRDNDPSENEFEEFIRHRYKQELFSVNFVLPLDEVPIARK
jgi:hypothetical protein